MTNQQLFNKVAKHLLTQKKRSAEADGEGLCLYRGPNGLKCAIGALIPNARYDSGMEKHTIDGVDWGQKIQSAAGIASNQVQLARDLQEVHDYTPTREWRKDLKEVARQHKLSIAWMT